jgi:hypothetical protein
MKLINARIKHILLVYINITLLSFAFATGASGDVEKHIYRIAISSKSFGKINTNDGAAAIKAWASTISKEQNLKVNFDVRLLNNTTDEIRKSIMDAEYDGYSISTPEFYEMNIDFPEYVYITKKQSGINLNYIIITHSQSRVISPQELINCKLITSDNNQMVLSLQWLGSILYKYAKGNKIDKPELVDNFSKAILQVFFRQADAALVTREAFDLACELNPQLRKDIKVIYESQPFISGFFIILQPPDIKQYEVLEKIILDVGKTPGGQQVLTVFQSTGIEKYPATVLEDTVKFLKNYKQMKEKTESMWIVQ